MSQAAEWIRKQAEAQAREQQLAPLRQALRAARDRQAHGEKDSTALEEFCQRTQARIDDLVSPLPRRRRPRFSDLG